jgi:hypothetical protein
MQDIADSSRTTAREKRHSLQHRAPEFHNSFQHFLCALANHDLVTIHQGEHGVRSLLNQFDQVRIHHYRMTVKACELNQVLAPNPASAVEKSQPREAPSMEIGKHRIRAKKAG